MDYCSLRSRTALSAALLLSLFAGACASNQPAAHSSGTSAAPAAIGTASSEHAAPAAGSNSGSASSKGGTKASPASQGWMAVVDGKEVPAPAIPMGDDAVVRRILEEGKNHNQVMDHLRYLTGTIGPRLTGSSAVFEANKWAMRQYQQWGLANPHLEQWGTVGVGFDRGPSTGKLLVKRNRTAPPGEGRRRRPETEAAAGKAGEATAKTGEPAPKANEAAAVTATEAAAAEAPKVEYITLRDFEFTTLAWTPGTNGPVRAPVIKMPKTQEQLDAVKDKLAGAWVLLEAPPASGQRGIRDGVGGRYQMRDKAREKAAKNEEGAEFTVAEKVALIDVAGYISTSRDERVWTGAVPGWRDKTMETLPKDVHVILRGSDYDALNSRLADGEAVECEFDLKNTFIPGPVPVYNTVAEIRGSTYPDEYVIVSAHMDSWNGPGSQGCTDNGTGTVVTLEAARLLMAAKAKPLRTIRFVNWTGEEQGLLGSKGYVKDHTAELEHVSAVFVDDGGTNYQGGVNVAENQVDFMAAATAPINNVFYCPVDKKFLNCDVKNTGKKIASHGSSDQASFNAVGVPGYYWTEVGRADYGYGWHTQNDKIDLAIPVYLEQSSTNAAIVAYRLACAPTLVPRAEASLGSSEDFRPKPALTTQEEPGKSVDPLKNAPAKNAAEAPKSN